MFCPVCESEYRPGISRCPTCDVDLVADPANARPVPAPDAGSALALEMLDYCGFLSLEDARHARDLLRPRRIRAEIVIRDAAESSSARPAAEEYWLRVPARSFPEAAQVLGHDAPDASAHAGPGTLACSECHEPVGEDESFCPHCGARFDE